MRDTIDMAREAGYDEHLSMLHAVALNRFAELVRADEREICTNAAMAAAEEAVNFAMALEREACAKVCYELPWKDMDHIPSNLAFAAAIRARGNT